MASRIRNDGLPDRRFKNRPSGGGMDNRNIQGMDAMMAKLEQIRLYIAEDVPHVIGVEAVKTFKNNFVKEGIGGKKWADRKSVRPGGTNGQRILSKSGELKDSIDYRVQGNTVIISSDKPYAEIHNEGGTITITPQMRKYFWAMHYQAHNAGQADVAEMYKHMALAKKINMPQRQFIGESDELNQNIINKVLRDLNRILA